MKKTIKTIICIALFSCLLISLLSACGSKMLTGDDSIKVHSITYSHGNSEETIYSSYEFEYTIDIVDVTEYENSKEKREDIYIRGTISIDGFARVNEGGITYEQTPNQLKDLVGKTYYYKRSDYNDTNHRYYKITYTDLHISYVNVTFINGDTFEVSYYSESDGKTITKRIKTEYYSITYFNENK